MTIYDGIMAFLVIAGMVWGAIRGITWQVASIASLVIGYSVAHPVSAQLAPHFPGDPAVARGLAMLATYVGVSGGIFFVAWLVRATLQKMKFEAYDRHLGMLLGGFEGALIGLVGTLFVVSLAPSSRAAIFESPTGRVVGQVMNAVGPVLPSEVRTKLAPFWDGEDAPAVARQEDDHNRMGRRLGIAPRDDDAVPVATSESDRASTTDSPLPKLQKVIDQEERRIGNAVADSVKGDNAAGSSAAAREGVSPSKNVVTKLGDILQDEEKKIGKAIVDSAKEEMQRIGEANDRDLERR